MNNEWGGSWRMGGNGGFFYKDFLDCFETYPYPFPKVISRAAGLGTIITFALRYLL